MTWIEWTGQSKIRKEDLRCPQCNREIFVASILGKGQVMCRDMGHWIGLWTECTIAKTEKETQQL